MSLTLSTYAQGDVNYISKMNSDNTAIAGAVNALQSIVGAGGATSIGNLLTAMFGSVTALIGAGSYVPTGSGTNLTVAPGLAYLPSSSNVVQSLTPIVIAFAGFGAATYYINVDATGNVIASATPGAGSLYSVVWTGSAFGAITRMAPIVAGGGEMNLSPGYISGTPSGGEIVFAFMFLDSAAFPNNFVGSLALADTAPSGTDTFTIYKNGVSIGSLILTSSVNGVFSTTSTPNFVRGDLLKVTAIGTPTLVGLNFSLLGTRLG
jgi:hypothetical protein